MITSTYNRGEGNKKRNRPIIKGGITMKKRTKLLIKLGITILIITVIIAGLVIKSNIDSKEYDRIKEEEEQARISLVWNSCWRQSQSRLVGSNIPLDACMNMAGYHQNEDGEWE